jgi:hypothetical protein
MGAAYAAYPERVVKIVVDVDEDHVLRRRVDVTARYAAS